MPLINATADVSNKARGLNFGLGDHLHRIPYFMYANREGSLLHVCSWLLAISTESHALAHIYEMQLRNWPIL